MIPIPRCLRAAGILLVVFFAAACGTTSQQDVTPAAAVEPPANFYIGNTDVYAHLDTVSGGSWIISKVTDSDAQPVKGFLVRLNDLAPAFDTRVAECEPQNYPADHKCSPVHPFRNKDVGVFEKIISGGIAAGTAGKVTDISRTYETSFDEAAFNRAVDEALTNTGLGKERRELLTALATYDQVVAQSRTAREQIAARLDATREDTASVPLDVELTVSGVTEYYSDDVDLRSMIELVPRTTQAAMPPYIEEQPLLPCAPRDCLGNTRAAIATRRAELNDLETQFTSQQNLQQNVFDIRCDTANDAGYLLKLDCPPEVTRHGAGPIVVPVTLHVLARDFDNLFPNIEISDEILRIDISGANVSFTNLSSHYVAVTAHSVYYNSQVHTATSAMNVAPGATVDQPMSEFVSPAIEVESSYPNMTPGKADSATFQFGFAAKYRVAGDTSDTTLFERQTYSVGCAIADQLAPGSCKHADKQASSRAPGSSF